MGKKNQTKYATIQIDDRFNKWTVISKPYIDKYAKVLCRCECGTEQAVDAYILTTGKSRSCIHCFNTQRHGSNNSTWKGCGEVPRSWFYRFEQYAKKKNNDFDITIEHIWALYLQQDKKCALTGLFIAFENTHPTGSKSIGLKCTASLDRIDSKKGYISTNIQLVHKDINIMKNHYDQSYFIEMCKAVTQNNNGSSTR